MLIYWCGCVGGLVYCVVWGLAFWVLVVVRSKIRELFKKWLRAGGFFALQVNEKIAFTVAADFKKLIFLASNVCIGLSK